MALFKKKGSPYWYTRFQIEGVPVYESTKTHISSLAQRYERKRMDEVYNQVMLGVKTKENKTWDDAKKEWEYSMSHKRSIEGDRKTFIWLHKHLHGKNLSQITNEIIENIAREKEKREDGTMNTPATINRTLALIKSVLNKAMKEWEWVDRVPYVRMRREPKGRIRWITKEEAYQRLLVPSNNMPKHLRNAVRLTLMMGCRSSNMVNLKWTQIDFVRKTVFIPAVNVKTDVDLLLPLSEDAIKILKEQIGDHPIYVFAYEGKPVTRFNTAAWRKALKRAGILDFRFHDLRHTWASWFIMDGGTILELKYRGGWKSMQMPERYAHLSEEYLRGRANLTSEAWA